MTGPAAERRDWPAAIRAMVAAGVDWVQVRDRSLSAAALLDWSRTVLEGFDDEDGVMLRVEREVSSDTMIVAGVETHILEHRTYHDGDIHEIAYNFYVEANDGTVCYFGEDVEFYEGGVLTGTDGTWRAGVDGAMPGIIMPASPAAGQAYFQENAPDNEALDMGKVEAVSESASFAGTTYDDVITIQDSSPFDDCEDEEKRYVPGIGEVQDVELELTEYIPPSAG